jgi:hypothetical protein
MDYTLLGVRIMTKCEIKPIEQYKIDPKKVKNSIISPLLWNYVERKKK